MHAGKSEFPRTVDSYVSNEHIVVLLEGYKRGLISGRTCERSPPRLFDNSQTDAILCGASSPPLFAKRIEVFSTFRRRRVLSRTRRRTMSSEAEVPVALVLTSVTTRRARLPKLYRPR